MSQAAHPVPLLRDVEHELPFPLREVFALLVDRINPRRDVFVGGIRHLRLCHRYRRILFTPISRPEPSSRSEVGSGTSLATSASAVPTNEAVKFAVVECSTPLTRYVLMPSVGVMLESVSPKLSGLMSVMARSVSRVNGGNCGAELAVRTAPVLPVPPNSRAAPNVPERYVKVPDASVSEKVPAYRCVMTVPPRSSCASSVLRAVKVNSAFGSVAPEMMFVMETEPSVTASEVVPSPLSVALNRFVVPFCPKPTICEADAVGTVTPRRNATQRHTLRSRERVMGSHTFPLG